MGLLALIPWKWWGIGGAVLIASAVFFYQRTEIHILQTDVAELSSQVLAEQKARKAEQDAAKALAALKEAEYAATEAKYLQQQETAQHEHQKALADNARVIAGLVAQRDGVRQQLASYASGGRPAADDTVTACRGRADAIGAVLAESLRVQEELAADAERESADARSLREAWPVK